MSVQYLGDFAEDKTIRFMFNTFDSNDPSASVTITNLIDTDVHIHKDNGLTQRNNAAGITVSLNFDGITGSHMIEIDTNDNTVAGFWVTGSDYFVRIEGTTIDAATINVVVAHFSIENRMKDVNVLTVAGTSQTANDNGADINTILSRIIGTLATGTHNPQGGDNYARIGVAGAGLTNINLPNQTMDIIGNITGNLSGSVGSLTANNDKTGYRLSSTGVDDILDETGAVALIGNPTNLRELIYFIVQVSRNKLEYVKATDKMKLYEDDNIADKWEHNMTDDATSATRGKGA